MRQTATVMVQVYFSSCLCVRVLAMLQTSLPLTRAAANVVAVPGVLVEESLLNNRRGTANKP